MALLMRATFEERREQWILDARARVDEAIATGRRPRPNLTKRHKPLWQPPPVAPPPPAVPIVEQYMRLRERVLAGEITPEQAGKLFSRTG